MQVVYTQKIIMVYLKKVKLNQGSVRQIKVIQERAWRRQKMRRRGTGIWYVLAIAAVAAGCILYIENLKNRSAEEYPVLEWIEAQKNQDIEAVEAKLLARDEAERAEQEEQAAGSEETLSPRQRFGQAVLVGDSVAEGFIDYQILDPSRIVAHKGMRSDTMENISIRRWSFLRHSFFCLSDLTIWNTAGETVRALQRNMRSGCRR